MTNVPGAHERHGATFGERGGRRVPLHYGRPDRVHGAVRKVVGVIEMGYGVVVVAGDDRREYVDNVVTNRVPAAEGEGCYALLLDPDGRVRTDLYVYEAGDRLLCLTPPGRAEPLADDWSEKTFIQDVDVRTATEEFAVFGVHGPKATEKIASVLDGASAPEERLTFVRGGMRDAGVTVFRTDAQAGEEGYEVVCAGDDAGDVFDVLVNHGLNAAPFGHDTWDALTLEAGTPLFETELDDRLPNVAGVRNALDFEKGCYVGQEVVSRVENRGRASHRLVGLELEAVPSAGAAVVAGDATVGEVTRGLRSPALDRPVAFAAVEADRSPATGLAVRVDGETVDATVVELPFVEGSERSARIPAYPGD